MRLMEKVRSEDICSGGGRGGTKRGSCWVEMESLKVLMVVGKKVMMWRKCYDMAGDLA